MMYLAAGVVIGVAGVLVAALWFEHVEDAIDDIGGEPRRRRRAGKDDADD